MGGGGVGFPGEDVQELRGGPVLKSGALSALDAGVLLRLEDGYGYLTPKRPMVGPPPLKLGVESESLDRYKGRKI